MRISDWSSDVCSSDLPRALHHRLQRGLVDQQRDMQVEIMLVLEVERPVAIFEERDIASVAQREIGVQYLDGPSGEAAADRQRRDQGTAEKIFVEGPGLLGIATAIGAVMKARDHPTALPGRSLSRIYACVSRLASSEIGRAHV